MQYRQLGSTGLRVSTVGLGTNNFGFRMDEESSIRVAKFAVDQGINFFDTANMYGRGLSEERIGKALKGIRKDIIIGTKVGMAMGDGTNDIGASRYHIMQQVEDSLRLLQTDYIDLYQIHRWDFSTPIEETLSALDFLVRDGKVRYLGASSMAAWQFSQALHVAKENGLHRFVSMQNHYNLIYREEEREMNPLCIDEGVALIPWSPLARGYFAGQRTKTEGEGPTKRAQTDAMTRRMYFNDSDEEVAVAVNKVAERHEKTPTQLACAWVLQSPGIVAPIIGATKARHLTEIFETVAIELTSNDIAEMEAPYRPHPILGHTQPDPKRMKR